MPKPEQFQKFTPEQELGKIKPRKPEIPKPIELTKEQDEHLLGILKQARTYEKEGNLVEAIKLYQQYQEEYSALKQTKEREKRKKEGIETITAETPEGKEIVFDFEKIREHWKNFYQENNLEEIAEALPERITLTKEQIERIKELSKEGFNHFLLLPENPDQYLNKIKQETSDKSLEGLPDDQQYNEEKGTYLSETVKPNFPDKIKTLNRPEKAYLVFLKDISEVEEETKDKSAEKLREEFKEKDLKGLTLTEYFIFQRDYTQRHQDQEKPHPETQNWTWLLDSELSEDSSGPGRVLEAYWISVHRQVGVGSHAPDDRFSARGARSSAIFEI